MATRIRLQGMTWGAGNAIGHRVVDAVMGPRTIKHETVVSEAAAPASAPPVTLPTAWALLLLRPLLPTWPLLLVTVSPRLSRK
ncbi:unnamed protein product [Brassica rapa subsp. narinosa]|uniref:(rape) hypothetical protein n=1 Tax=Brassica napus TaxID=3708 RepID=A0A817B9C0_BRANA|nr:unnamed protein product [Brassica napus]